MNRVLIDGIIERARDLRRIEGNELVKDALVDITLDIALQMATKTNNVVDQAYVDPKVKRRAVLKLCTDWRAVVSGVRAVYNDHPITNHHLYVTLLAYFPSLLERGAVLKDEVVREVDYLRLLNVETRQARKVLHEVLSHKFH